MNSELSKIYRSSQYGLPVPQKKLYTAIIQSDDPTHMFSTYRQVTEIASTIKQIQESLALKIPNTLTKTSTQPERQESNIKKLFKELAATWREESAFCSSLLEMVTLPSYQRIIGMDRPVIPHILASLLQEPDHWFWALKAITGEDPVPPEDRGNLRKMTQAWLIWGARNGYEY